MASVIFDSSIGGDAGMTIKSDWLNGSFDKMVNDLPDITTKALNVAAYIIKQSVKDSLGNKMPAAKKPFKVPATSSRGYKITRPDKLIDAARQSPSNEFKTSVYMGGREPNSPLFIARMYDKGSKDRYVRTYKGQKLAKKRFAGKLTGVDYWGPGVSAGENEAMRALENVIYNALEKQF